MFSRTYTPLFPGDFINEIEFINRTIYHLPSCARYFYFRWYDFYVRGMNKRLPEPHYTGGPIHVFDEEADRIYQILMEESKKGSRRLEYQLCSDSYD